MSFGTPGYRIVRRGSGIALVSCLALLLTTALQAAESPVGSCANQLAGRRVTLVVPYAPGGGWDSYGRLFASAFEAQTGGRVLVRNIVGAGGMLGIRAVAEARPTTLTLGIFNPVALLESQRSGLAGPTVEDFQVLGSLVTDTVLAAGRNDWEGADPGGEPIIVGALDTELAMTFLAMKALAWPARPVLGYSGSAERFLALLRGEIDLIVGTAESLANSIAAAPDTRPVLALTRQPDRRYPQLPYLAGADGLVDRLTRDLDSPLRSQRLQLAELAATISQKPRSINVSSQLDPSVLNCLRGAVEQTLFEGDLSELAQDRGLDYAPGSAADAQAVVTEIRQQMMLNDALIDQVLNEYRAGR